MWFLSAGERADSQTQDSMDWPVQAGTGGPGGPQPMSVAPNTRMFPALLRRWDWELPRESGEG